MFRALRMQTETLGLAAHAVVDSLLALPGLMKVMLFFCPLHSGVVDWLDNSDEDRIFIQCRYDCRNSLRH